MNNQALAHAWAHQSRPSGKGSNFYYEGPTLYSYGEHFVVAHLLPGNKVLFNEGSYSTTTSMHQAHARRALPPYMDVIRVPGLTQSDLASPDTINARLREHMLGHLSEACSQRRIHMKTRNAHLDAAADTARHLPGAPNLAQVRGDVKAMRELLHTCQHEQALTRFKDECKRLRESTCISAQLARSVSHAAKLAGKRIPKKLAERIKADKRKVDANAITTSLDAAAALPVRQATIHLSTVERIIEESDDAVIQGYGPRLEEARKEHEERAVREVGGDLRKELARNTPDCSELERLLEHVPPGTLSCEREQARKAFLQAKHEKADQINQWREGEVRSAPGGVGTLLRLSKDRTRIQTSHFAEVNVDVAKRVWSLLETVRSWAPGTGPRLGHNYRLDKVTEDGGIVAGCHHIAHDELAYIAEQLGIV